MKHSRLVIATAGAAATALALAGCSSGGSGDAGSTAELTFLAPIYSDATQPYWEDLVASFEEEHPGITIDLQMVSWEDISQRVNTMVANGEEPDILNFNSHVSFAADDLLMPVDELLPADLVSDFIPALLANGEYEGDAYGIPMIASVRALFYNADLLAAAGYDEPPVTWDEFLETAQAVTAAGTPGYGMFWGTGSETESDFSAFMWNNGGDWKSGDEWTIEADENVEALEFLQALTDTYGVTQTGANAAQREEVWQLFGSGGVAMVQGSNFLPTSLAGWGSDVNYGVAAMPVADGNEPATLAVEDYLMVFNTTEYPDEAAEFLSYFYEPDNYELFLQNEGMLPATQSTADQMTESDPEQAPFIELLGDARFYPTDDPVWPTVQDEARRMLGTVIGGQTSPADVLAQLQAIAVG